MVNLVPLVVVNGWMGCCMLVFVGGDGRQLSTALVVATLLLSAVWMMVWLGLGFTMLGLGL